MGEAEDRNARTRHRATPIYDNAVWPGVTRKIICDPGAAPGLGLVLLRCEPGTGAADHTHPCQEGYIVLDGTMELWMGDDRRKDDRND